MRAPFFRDRLKGIDLDRLDDPAVWAKIPLLTKDQLRQIPIEQFHQQFCVAPRADVVEYWRSGGVTGRPLQLAPLYAALGPWVEALLRLN